MSPRASALHRLAPDQRAAVELVLRQGRSYGELADLLGLPEDTIRARARGGLTALAGDTAAPARAGEICDFLLGQQAAAHAERTRALLAADPAAAAWAAAIAEPLRAVPGGESVPELNGRAPSGAAPARSSRLGGALLIGAAALVVAAVLAFVFTRGDDGEPAAEAPVATAEATPTISPNDILLRGPAGSEAVGLMRLVGVNDGTVRFAIAAQGVAPNGDGETYAVWFRKENGDTQLIGDVKTPITNGELTTAGPSNQHVEQFPEWFATYDAILVTLDPKDAKEPGKVILSGELPHASSG